jgi:hypothetical protein
MRLSLPDLSLVQRQRDSPQPRKLVFWPHIELFIHRSAAGRSLTVGADGLLVARHRFSSRLTPMIRVYVTMDEAKIL